MSTWAPSVAEIQRILKIPPGKFTVKKMDDGEVLQLHVAASYTLSAVDVKALSSVSTPNNRTPVGLCIDFAESIVGVMYGDVELRVFPRKLDSMQINFSLDVSSDVVNDFLEMSNVHPVIADLEMDDNGECLSVTSSGPLMYYMPIDGCDCNVQFQFGDRCSVLTIPRPRAKRRRFNRT